MSDEDQWHQVFAAQAFNRTWDLLETDDRSDDQDAEMLAAVLTQRHHWYQVGQRFRFAIADWQVSRVFAALGDGEQAVRFAARAVAIAEEGDGPPFLPASCYEGAARAAAAAGDATARDGWLDKARAALDAIEDDEERALIEGQIDSVPGA